MKLLTTGSATSASSNATRTSRSVSATFSSVTRPRPRMTCTARPRRSVNLSNMLAELTALYSYGASDYKRPVDKTPTSVLILILLGLLLIIAFSSGTEVAMLSVNRYRIRHRANQGQRRARLLERLLAEPDRWLGANLVILALASVAATTVVNVLARRTGHPIALPVMVIALAVFMIVFCELAPTICAAAHAEPIALGSAYVYRVLLWVTGPINAVTNQIAQGFLSLFGVRPTRESHTLSSEELRTVVSEASTLVPARHRQMLLSI